MDNADTFDYAELQKGVLIQLKSALSAVDTPDEYLLNLVNTALDYGFYLTDERIK